MLNEIGNNIWTVDGPNVVFAGASMHTRMTIVKLDDGTLWIHSPIKYNPEVKHAIKSLGGAVTALVAPNKFHHMFVEHWAQVHPAAKIFAESTLRDKIVFLQDAEELTNTASQSYDNDIEQVVFAGNRLFQEVVFFHKKSKTLIMTDLMINLRTEGIKFLPSLFLRFEGAVFPNGGITTLYRFFTTDKNKARDALAIIRAWAPQRLTFCHGEPFSEAADETINKQFRWLDS